jgi:hypothetical protein
MFLDKITRNPGVAPALIYKCVKCGERLSVALDEKRAYGKKDGGLFG